MSRPVVAVALVPGVLALLPQYSSIEDPVAELRAACLAAVGRLGPRVRVVASPATGGSGSRVGASLVSVAGADVVDSGETGVLIVGNGSAARTEKAPGFLDERAEAFDAAIGSALRGDLRTLDVDGVLAGELWAETAGFGALSVLVQQGTGVRAQMLYDDAPFGVQYWVAVWG